MILPPAVEKLRAPIRMNIRQLLFVFLAFFLMVLISCLFLIDMVEREIAMTAEELLSVAGSNIYTRLREVEITTLNTALMIEGHLTQNRDKDLLERLLQRLNKKLLAEDERLSDMTIMGGVIDGVLYSGLESPPAEDFQPESRPWYTAAIEAEGRIAFTGPYTDVRTGGRILSFSKEIYTDDGLSCGVVEIDMTLDDIVGYISSVAFADGGYGLIIGPDGKFIAHPDPAWIDRHSSEISPSYAEIEKQILLGESAISAREILNTTGIEIVMSLQRMSNGWYIGVATPSASYFQDMVSVVTMLSVLGLVMAVFLSYFLIRISLAKIQSDEESLSKSSFLARMSHEIRTPMNSILGMSELILQKDVPREVSEYVTIIRQAGTNLLAIINDILDFSKIEAGRRKIVFERYYLASLINDIVNVVRIRLIDRDIAFFVKVDADIPQPLVGDEVSLRQVLQNILSNAVKYTRAGHIALRIRHEDLGDGKLLLVCSVEDSGIGIQPEHLDQLFSDFTRLEKPHSDNVEGTGLGLAIARSLCRAMDGDVTVESRYGRGSTFTATVIQGVAGTTPLAAVEKPSERRILVLEDRPAYLSAVAFAFEGLGTNPVYTQSAEQFEYELAGRKYDFAFVSPDHFSAARAAMRRGGTGCRLVRMAGLGEIAADAQSEEVATPIFCVGIANIMNGAPTNAPTLENRKRRTSFTAPGAKVLVVDDIATNLRVSKELLALYGMEIHTCLNGWKAVELARIHRYDIVFMDHMMPDIDGIEATAMIRAIDGEDGNSYCKDGRCLRYANVPIVALTANAVAGQREMFLQNGMDDFLAKPIEIHKLEAILQKWLPAEKRVAQGGLPPAERERSADEGSGDCGDTACDNAADGLPRIPGISVKVGLRNLGGSAAAYRNILRDFCKDAEEQASRLESCFSSGDLSLYRTLVHALKGAARSIGATALGESAARQEDAARSGDREAVAGQHAKFLAELSLLTGAIGAALGGGGEDGNAGFTETAVLGELKAALSRMDIHTVNKLLQKCVESPLPPPERSAISEIERHILMFEYDEAIAKIDALQASGT
ncbi:MAG: response regulator [Clostridiales bacterium]|jgi:signal transduction histidine kinase/CheY-like chemotaxis protein/HPt (histidine-containing phosphotransfer) domain-containing protein|nr:response regulator [Clostridiales bacterium]